MPQETIATVDSVSHVWSNIRLAFQPVHHVQCRQPAGAEALLRSLEPDGSLLGPMQVLAQAERSGTDIDLTYYVATLAARQAAIWTKEEWLQGYRVGINVSPRVLGEANFAQRLLKILEDSSCDPRNILVELTETQYLDHFRCAITQIRELRSAGVLFALDDFGIGHSNIGLLSALPVDMIKVDPVVFGAEPGAREINIMSHVVGLAESVGAVVVAEGIETTQQWNCVEAAGVDYVQGWLLSRATLPGEVAPGWGPTDAAPCTCWT
ncbi:MAG: EAL domain-containing protein [Actinomycetes bacterium]